MRSLNTSTKNEVTYKKLLEVTGNKDDFIFLCDLRLNSSKNKTVVHDVDKMCFNLGYKSFFRSTVSNRGVGILIKKEVKCRVINIIRDKQWDNFILLNVELGNKNITLGAIYGPNHDNEIAFYEKLKKEVDSLCNENIILGGDWNATWDNSRVEKNLDTLNMVDIPSLIRSNTIIKMAETLRILNNRPVLHLLSRKTRIHLCTFGNK